MPVKGLYIFLIFGYIFGVRLKASKAVIFRPVRAFFKEGLYVQDMRYLRKTYSYRQ